MPSFAIGPFSFAADRLVAVAAVWVFVALVAMIGHGTRERGEQAGIYAIIAGLVAARAGFVVAHRADFASDPASAFMVWQGGFVVWAGLPAAALAVLIVLKSARARALSLLALAAISAAALTATSLLTPPPRPMPHIDPLARLNGGTIDLAAMKGTPYVVNLWATWCPPCRRELPMLAQEASRGRVAVVLADQGEDAASVAAYLARANIATDRVALDPAMQLSRVLGANGYPVTLFVDAHGMIVQVHSGEIGRAELSQGIDQLEKDNE